MDRMSKRYRIRKSGTRNYAAQINLDHLRRHWSEFHRHLAEDPGMQFPLTRAIKAEAEALEEGMRADAMRRPQLKRRQAYLNAIEAAKLPQALPTKRPRRHFTRSEVQAAAARFPTWRGPNDDQPPARITGVVWWGRKHIVNGVASGGWALRINTKFGKYLNTRIPDDITLKELADYSDLFRYHLIARGYMGTRKQFRKTERDILLRGRARYNDAAGMKVMAEAECVPDLMPSDPIHAHLLNWMTNTDAVEESRAKEAGTGRIPLARKDLRANFDARWSKMTRIDE